jgi:hypothetical protein
VIFGGFPGCPFIEIDNLLVVSVHKINFETFDTDLRCGILRSMSYEKKSVLALI